MKIVVLGWGSLVWGPRNLRIDGEWHTDGPSLPIEFARVSKDKRLTLALFPKADKIQVLWAYMELDDLDGAISTLAAREETSRERIGFVNIRNNRLNSKVAPENEIKEWVKRKNIDAVIWTDLPSNFKEKTKQEFTDNNVIKYLENLPPEAKEKAKEYIKRTPPQVQTRMRKVIEERLGWAHEGNYR